MSDSLRLQQPFRPALPVVIASKDYREEVALYQAIDHVIVRLGLDLKFVRLVHPEGHVPSNDVGKLVTAFRILVVDFLRGAPSVRELSRTLADSRLLQWFCGLEEFGKTSAPSKSAIDRMRGLVAAESLVQLGNELLQACGDTDLAKTLGLKKACELDEAWFDATCLEANIHYPTDWVLLADIVRTLGKAIRRMREAGARNRMPDSPEVFTRRMNKLCIEMSQLRGKRNSAKAKKKLLRKMLKETRKMGVHARKHIDKLDAAGGGTMKAGHLRVLSERVEAVLEKLPEAVRQAEERILHGRLVPSGEKLLSLHEEGIHVVKRSKGNVSTEFGNVLLVGESRDGLLVDLHLCEENEADVSLLSGGVERAETATGKALEMVCADRGFHSAENEEWLSARGTRSEVCPRGKRRKKKAKEEKAFRSAQKRRAQTEGRISILRHAIMGGRLRVKGFANRRRAVAWAQLSHNLWIIGRLVCGAG